MNDQQEIRISKTDERIIKNKLLVLLKEANKLSDENDLEQYWQQQLDIIFAMERCMDSLETAIAEKDQPVQTVPLLTKESVDEAWNTPVKRGPHPWE